MSKYDRNHWKDVSYLKFGTERQKDAYASLREARVLDLLSNYDATLVGTIPLDIDLPGSDLDIVCMASDLGVFAQTIKKHFGTFQS